MPYSQAKLNNIRGMVKDIGVDATATRLGISRESIRRATRLESRRESTSPKESIQSKDSLIDSLSERFSRRELQAIAVGGLCSQKIVKPKLQQTSGKFIMGVMTDTHFGSVYTSTELVAMAFDAFKKAGVNAIVIAGDVTEGLSSRAGHVFELTHVGFKAQLDHAVEMLSQWTYSPIYMIDGNHDRWYIKAVGAHIVPSICERVHNAYFLGHDEGDFSIGSANIKLWHGEDGSSYAFSYRIQKLVEAFTGGEKPNILICGHTHKSMYMICRHIHCLSAGAIQRQSKWMRSKRQESHTGFWTVEIGLSKDGVSAFTPTWFPAYI